MTSRRPLLVSLLSSLALAGAVACKDAEPASPPGALIGRFGGTNAELVAKAQSVTAQFGCGPLRGSGALVPDASGNFYYAFAPRLLVSSFVYTVVGNVQGDVISFDIASAPSTGAKLTRFVVRRGAPADFSSTACSTLGL